MRDKISVILKVILLTIPSVYSIYLYFENKRLKGFEVDKNLKMKEAEWARLVNNHHLKAPGTAYYYRSELSAEEMQEEENKFKYKESCLKAEIEHLKKLKKHKWLFSRKK